MRRVQVDSKQMVEEGFIVKIDKHLEEENL